ncbi:glycoside hydrolase family 18 protein [Fodinibius sediminis]|uniref:chitinase n=1 Tax=Fodinibius sediminis TaxID=1214077 RepID=A0A521BHU5_9BACT|nr:glycoside hydrolase family 18 protein [Fodinibius sediminis]SMO46481.1 chitinase [Fodinibius sediminis]
MIYSNSRQLLQTAFLSLLIWVVFAPDGAAQQKSTSPFRIIAYADGGVDSWKMDAGKLTHINYSFAHVNDKGEIHFRDEIKAARRLARLQKLKAKNPALKLLVSVGGWGADGFSDAALTAESRDIFSSSAVKLIKTYGLDGIDIDWEFPGQPGPGIKYRPEDKGNFTLMLKSLRTHLDSLSDERGLTGDDRFLLTIASNDDQSFFDHTQMDQLHPYLDFINVMTYDMFTVGSETTGHHTGLYQSSPGAPARTAAAAVRRHLDAGIPARKIVLGAAFYGRSWSGVNPENKGLYQPFEEFYEFIPYARLKSDFINEYGFKRYWDDGAKAPYLWNIKKKIMVAYEDPESLKHKAAYIRDKGLGGVMYWHHSYDPEQILLQTLHRELTRQEPSKQ